MSLHLVPVTFETACGFVDMWHRHHRPPVGHKYSIGVADDSWVLRGVAIVGRPVARHLDDGATLEVARTATDSTPNTNSMLYAAAWRAAKALGYRRLVTYTQAGESGASVRAAGWRVLAQRPAQPGWDRPSRPREDRGTGGIPPHPMGGRAMTSHELHLTAVCLADCGVIAEGTTADKPAGRHDSKWSEVDAAAERHTKRTGHATSSSAVAPEVTG